MAIYGSKCSRRDTDECIKVQRQTPIRWACHGMYQVESRAMEPKLSSHSKHRAWWWKIKEFWWWQTKQNGGITDRITMPKESRISFFFKDRQGKVSWLNTSKLKVREIWCLQTQDLLLGASVRLNVWLNEPKHVGPLISRNVASLILQWSKPYSCWFPHSLIMKRCFYGMCMQTWSRVCQSAHRKVHIHPIHPFSFSA